MPGPGGPAELDVGDRVVARTSLGGFLRARVSRGAAGVVVSRSSAGRVRVRFSNGHTLDVAAADVALADPWDLP